MDVTHVEQRAYIKIAVLRETYAMECYSELVEALGNNALPYCAVARWIGKFQQPVMSNRSVYGPTWHVPSSNSSWITLWVMDYIKGL
ncbi:HTH_48 domain-containing protein [Trichonephila clavipes]|nr:HTH_48 domain-containing protein [Trichonephila clavipes]